MFLKKINLFGAFWHPTRGGPAVSHEPGRPFAGAAHELAGAGHVMGRRRSARMSMLSVPNGQVAAVVVHGAFVARVTYGSMRINIKKEGSRNGGNPRNLFTSMECG